MSNLFYPPRFLGSLLLVLPIAAYGQATRTWISGVGDDANPCSRTAPCKTFAGAISKTATGGEIDVLDPGGFGAVTITKSITLDGSGAGTMAGILVSGTNGVVVSATGGNVILRGLDFEGLGTSLSGVSILNAASVHIEDSRFDQFSVGINAVPNVSGSTTVFIKNTKIRNCSGTGTANPAVGLVADATTGAVNVVTDGLSIINCPVALTANAGAKVTATNSNFSGNGAGVAATAGATVTLDTGTVSDSSSPFHGATSTGNGVTSTGAATVVRLTNMSIFDNAGAGLASSSGGSIISFVNNRIYGNNPNGTPTSSVYQK